MRSRLILFSFLAVFVILVCALIAGFLMPRQWSVRSTTTVAAPPSAVQALLATPRRYPEWFPWSKVKAPDIVYSFSGPESGVGSALTWTSTSLGQGTLTLTRADPDAGVSYDLVISGFGEHPIHGQIALAALGGTTSVTLTEGGELGTNPIARLFRGVVEGKLTYEHDHALDRLKALAEGRPPPPEPPPMKD
jgi:uncharacterized protein YndB with AHSA1/START domain